MFATVADPNWSIAGVGDFTDTQDPDILWRQPRDRREHDLVMNGAANFGRFGVHRRRDGSQLEHRRGPAIQWNGKSDILWRNSTTGGERGLFL